MKLRWVALLAAVSILFCSMPFITAAQTTAYTFESLTGYYKTQGRVALDGTALQMDTTSSGFEWYFEGGGDVSLKAEFWCNYSTDMYLTVIVDGVRSRVCVDTAKKATTVTKTLTLAKALPQGLHHVQVYKASEAVVSRMKTLSVTFDGVPIATPPLDKLTMEVVGDSISSGASMWSPSSDQSIPADYPVFLDGTKTYAYLTGEALGANVRVTQTSGYGCVNGFNTDGVNLQKMYPYTNYWRNSAALYAFDPPADIVVINLGTNDALSQKVTEAQFAEGAFNLMSLARQKNPGADVVWCTGMMGTFFKNVLLDTVAQLGGNEAGYFFCELPYGVDGGYGHPNVAQHQAAATVLTAFLLNNCLPENYMQDFADAAALQAAVDDAKTIESPTGALVDAIRFAEAELAWGTTDAYRLGVRLHALYDALRGETAVSLMPRQYVATCPMESNGTYIWPYYGATDGSVTLYKGGQTFYWPRIETLQEPVAVSAIHTPLWRICVSGTAYFNIMLTFLDTTGTKRTVKASQIGGYGEEDFAPGAWDLTLDLGSYMTKNGYADEHGYVPLLSCEIFVVGVQDVYTTFTACELLTADAAVSVCGDYAVFDNVLQQMTLGTTAEQLLAATSPSAYLSVVDENGARVSGALTTGMSLVLSVDSEVQERLLIALKGDVNGDGRLTTGDCRAALILLAKGDALSALHRTCADYDGDAVVQAADVRAMLLACLLKE